MSITEVDGQEFDEKVLTYDDSAKTLSVETEIRPDTVLVSYLLFGQVNRYEDYASGFLTFDVEI